jgi:hypothetical protein
MDMIHGVSRGLRLFGVVLVSVLRRPCWPQPRATLLRLRLFSYLTRSDSTALFYLGPVRPDRGNRR